MLHSPPRFSRRAKRVRSPASVCIEPRAPNTARWVACWQGEVVMGDQRRSDSDRAKATQDEPEKRQPRDEQDAQFDTAHAQTQRAFHRKGNIVDQPSIPTHVVETNGRIDEQETR